MLMNVTAGRVWAEVYLDSLVKNCGIIRKKVGNAQIMAAIKADAYGHGAVEVARTLESEQVRMFGVASIEEGIELRQAGITSEILVLSPILYPQIDAALEFNLVPTITETGFFQKFEGKLKKLKRSMPVHIEVDTGMTRTGLSYQKAIDSIVRIQKSPHVQIEGVFSHFPLADGDGAFTTKQIKDFSQLLRALKKLKVKPKYVHLANSSGLFKHDRSHFELVRPGISLYGLTASPDIEYARGLAPVMALKSKVVNVRVVKANTAISYGHTFITKTKSTIATISVGYGDGYPRALSNIGDVLIRGKRARIVGTICMDLIMVDITRMQTVRVGDIVTLIGKDGRQEISAEECALKANTIVYEITSGIGPRVARVFKNKDRIISMRNLLGRWRFSG